MVAAGVALTNTGMFRRIHPGNDRLETPAIQLLVPQRLISYGGSCAYRPLFFLFEAPLQKRRGGWLSRRLFVDRPAMKYPGITGSAGQKTPTGVSRESSSVNLAYLSHAVVDIMKIRHLAGQAGAVER